MGPNGDRASSRSDLKTRIAEWQARVLQLDRRNGLLYFKASRSSVRILTEDVDDLYQNLEDSEKGLSFDHVQPRGRRDERNLFAPESSADDESEPDYFVIEGDLDTDGDPRELQKRLSALRKREREWMEEQGLNVLFLAVGTLQWIDDEGTRAIAPLFLCPCDLLRESPRDPFLLLKEGDDPVHNSTLRQKVGALGVEIPDLGQESPSQYLDRVREAIRGKPDWVVREDVYLATFAFSKMAIWEDLDAMRKQGVDHPLVRCLAGDIGSLRDESEKHASPFPPVAELTGGRLDDLIGVKNEHTVMEADFSQLISIERARAGSHMVIHGPPGTGKSQTIANIIAGLLADGKRVLFVSEKTAALDVVKRRLEECDLGVFCLDLHSERGRKASVYGQLRDALDESRTRAKGVPFEKLEKIRTQLNTLTRELHRVREPLGLTVFQVQGRFSLVHDYPVVDFSVTGVGGLTGERLSQIDGALARIQRRQREYSEHGTSRWRALKARSSTLRLTTDIRDVANALGGAIEELDRESEATGRWLGTERPRCAGEASRLVPILDAMATCPGVPSAWCSPSRRRKFRDLYGRALPKVEEVRRLDGEIAVVFTHSPALESIPDILTLLNIDESKGRACRVLLGADWDRLLLERNELVARHIAAVESSFRGLLAGANALHSLLMARPTPDSLDDVPWALDTSLALGRLPVLPAVWSTVEGVRRIEVLAERAGVLRRELTAAEMDLASDYSLRLVDAVDEDMLLRFKVDYQSFWRRLFSMQYRRDWRTVAGNRTSSGKLVREDILSVLNRVMQVKEKRAELKEQMHALSMATAGVFDASVGDWEVLTGLLGQVPSLLVEERLSGDTLPSLLCSKEAKKELGEARATVLERMRALRQTTDMLWRECAPSEDPGALPTGVAYLEGVSRGAIDPATHVSDILEALTAVRAVAEILAGARSRLSGCLSDAVPSLESLRGALRAVQNRDECRRTLDDIWRTLFAEVPEEFLPETGDWASLGPAAQWMGGHGEALPDITSDVLKCHLEHPQQGEDYRKPAARLKGLVAKLAEAHAAAGLIFSLQETPCPDAETFRFETGKAWSEEILEAPESAHAWLDYLQAVEEVHAFLEDGVVDGVWQATDNADEVPGVVLRRVYEAWLDHAYATTTELRTTAPDLDARRRSFKDLDRAFVLANRERVRERCFGKYPDQGLPTRGLGELGQLQTELTKKRRQRPVRWLMEEIPNVIQSLKPCFLMSPLAVSQFLPRCAVTETGPAFDTVIFDEASQVFPWDAIPALSRADQAVVVGDEHQLPPTHFFRSEGADEDDAPLEEADVTPESLTVGRESILDAMVGLKGLAVEEHSLMVHYRSRHEDLIRYSNRYFYDGRLLVFPTASPGRPDLGLRDVYLPDARYDAGGTRTNPGEAEAVVDKVFELMRDRPPKESIGVVALSRAQADLIERLVNERRLVERALDDRFAEDRHERFFVKNLENVQGDERDHIILDIGYGPTVGSDAVPNRFGPLSHDGGHRRLNVAVSRARMSLTVVHSLRPQDITSEMQGPRLLRRYLEYVASPAGALEAGEVRPTTDAPESEFEEAVYRALVSRGHKVFCQVGCNGYFIDLAVEAEDGSGFDLGIECDGATYHSSPSARDRDWQRQSVLEGLGWTIHRIWSRSWILDPAREVARVEEALERARQVRSATVPSFEPKSGDDASEKYRETVQVAASDSAFDPYQRILFKNIPRHDISSASDNEIASKIAEVVKVEQPVHEQVVWKRLRALYRCGRIGRVIEDRLRQIQKTAVRNGLFVYLDDSIGGDHGEREFFCLPGAKSARPRGTDSSGGRTRIHEISFVELAAGLEAVVARSYGITPGDAIVATSREFGFARTGDEIRGRLSMTLDRLQRSGRMVEKDGKLFPGNLSP